MSEKMQEQTEQTTNPLNALQQAMAAKKDQEIVVKAEDLQEEGIDWGAIFLEPQPGETWTVKFLMNLNPNLPDLVHRSIYKKLPDPKRKGKTFRYISSGKSDTCKPLELFFELNDLKKNGDVLAEQKIEKYLGRSQEAGCIVQVLSGPKPSDASKLRILSFATWGENATIANMINKLVNPTKTQIENGDEKVNIFKLTPTPALIIECEKATYDGKEGRAFSKSSWTRKDFGMRIYSGVEGDENRQIEYEFAEGDIDENTFAVAEGKEKFVAKAIELLQAENVDLLNQFAYKNPKTEGLTEDTQKYIKTIFEKVEEVIPMIRDAKSIGELEAKLGSNSESNDDDAEMIGDESKEDLLKKSIPNLDQGTAQASTENVTNEQPAETSTATSVDDILEQANKA